MFWKIAFKLPEYSYTNVWKITQGYEGTILDFAFWKKSNIHQPFSLSAKYFSLIRPTLLSPTKLVFIQTCSLTISVFVFNGSLSHLYNETVLPIFSFILHFRSLSNQQWQSFIWLNYLKLFWSSEFLFMPSDDSHILYQNSEISTNPIKYRYNRWYSIHHQDSTLKTK